MKTVLFLFNKQQSEVVRTQQSAKTIKHHFPPQVKLTLVNFFSLHTIVETFRFLNYLLLNLPLFHLRDAKVFLII